MQSDVLLAMVMCSLFLGDVPMGYREKVILCVLIMKYMDMYIKTEADLIWVNNQLKKMESEFIVQVGVQSAICLVTKSVLTGDRSSNHHNVGGGYLIKQGHCLASIKYQ